MDFQIVDIHIVDVSIADFQLLNMVERLRRTMILNILHCQHIDCYSFVSLSLESERLSRSVEGHFVELIIITDFFFGVQNAQVTLMTPTIGMSALKACIRIIIELILPFIIVVLCLL